MSTLPLIAPSPRLLDPHPDDHDIDDDRTDLPHLPPKKGMKEAGARVIHANKITHLLRAFPPLAQAESVRYDLEKKAKAIRPKVLLSPFGPIVANQHMLMRKSQLEAEEHKALLPALVDVNLHEFQVDRDIRTPGTVIRSEIGGADLLKQIRCGERKTEWLMIDQKDEQLKLAALLLNSANCDAQCEETQFFLEEDKEEYEKLRHQPDNPRLDAAERDADIKRQIAKEALQDYYAMLGTKNEKDEAVKKDSKIAECKAKADWERIKAGEAYRLVLQIKAETEKQVAEALESVRGHKHTLNVVKKHRKGFQNKIAALKRELAYKESIVRMWKRKIEGYLELFNAWWHRNITSEELDKEEEFNDYMDEEEQKTMETLELLNKSLEHLRAKFDELKVNDDHAPKRSAARKSLLQNPSAGGEGRTKFKTPDAVEALYDACSAPPIFGADSIRSTQEIESFVEVIGVECDMSVVMWRIDVNERLLQKFVERKNTIQRERERLEQERLAREAELERLRLAELERLERERLERERLEREAAKVPKPKIKSEPKINLHAYICRRWSEDFDMTKFVGTIWARRAEERRNPRMQVDFSTPMKLEGTIWETRKDDRESPRRGKANQETLGYFHYNSEKLTQLESDWAMVCAKPKFVEFVCRYDKEIKRSDQDVQHELDEILNVLAESYTDICNSFQYYCATGTTIGEAAFSMPQLRFKEFLTDATIPKKGSKYCQQRDCDMMFTDVNKEEEESDKESKQINEANDDRALMRFEFLEMVVRMGVAKYGRGQKTKDVSEAVAMLGEKNISGKLPLEAALDPNIFRAHRLYTKEMSDLIEPYLSFLKALYNYAKKHKVWMGMEQWVALLNEMHLIGNHTGISRREGKLVFIWSQMPVQEEIKNRERYTGWTFIDFLEGLCRTADLLAAPTPEELDEYFHETNKSEHDSRLWEFYKEVKDDMAAKMRRSSAGSVAEPTRPLPEKMGALLEIMSYEYMHQYHCKTLDGVVGKLKNKKTTGH